MVTSTVIQRQEVSNMKKLKLLSIPNSEIVDENIKVIIEGRQSVSKVWGTIGRNYRLYKIRTAPLSERCSIENYHSMIIAGVLKNEKV